MILTGLCQKLTQNKSARGAGKGRSTQLAQAARLEMTGKERRKRWKEELIIFGNVPNETWKSDESMLAMFFFFCATAKVAACCVRLASKSEVFVLR